jgi:sugar porter (SP) family MFS transporter
VQTTPANLGKTSGSLQGAPAYVWFIASVAALGGLLFGYDWVVIGGARQFYEAWFHLDTVAQVGWANSCALLGCLLGSMVSGYTADRFGRRPLLLAAAVLFGISSIATGWAFTFPVFIFWRIAGGVAIGVAANVSPIYIAEVSPAASRGRLVSLNQFAIVVGILLAQVVNAVIAQNESGSETAAAHAWNLAYGWRWMFCAVAVPSALFFAGTFFLPESPRWLIGRGRLTKANAVLDRIVGKDAAHQESEAIARSLREDHGTPAGWGEMLRPAVLPVLLLAIAIAVLQQWTGINILFNYAAEVYRGAGYGSNQILLDIVITGSINLLATVLAMFLVDTVGRRRLMLFGCAGIGISHLLCALAYHRHMQGLPILALTLMAIACYACTLAPVTWVLLSEIFPNRVRSRGMSIAGSALWIASFLLTYTFPLMVAHLGIAGTFAMYAGVCFAGFLLVSRAVRETRGSSLEDRRN